MASSSRAFSKPKWNDRISDPLLKLMNPVDEIGLPLRGHHAFQQIFDLLDERHDARGVDLWGQGAFHHIVRNGVFDNTDSATMVAHIQRLQGAGANVNLRDDKGKSALHLFYTETYCYCDNSACPSAAFDEQLLENLTRAGAEIDMRDDLGQTPLFILVQRWVTGDTTFGEPKQGLESMCEAFLQLGAHINISDLKGRSILHAATSNRACGSAFLEFLMSKGLNPQIVDCEGRSILHEAASNIHRDSAFLQFLSDKGLDPRSMDYQGNTLWHAAINRLAHTRMPECIELATFLATSGVDLHKTNRMGRTPLHQASSVWGPSNGTSPDPGFQSKSRALELSDRDPATCFDYLLGLCVADVNVQDAYGVTPLQLACTFSPYQTRRLLNAGADSLLKTNEGLTVLHLAARSRQANTMGIILEHLSTQLERQTIRDLVDAVDMTGRTALEYACVSGRAETVRLLLDFGATACGDEFFNSLWHAVSEFADEGKNWRESSLRWHSYEEKAGAVLIHDKMRPPAVLTAPLYDVVDIIVTLDRRQEFLDEAIEMAASKHSCHVVECLLHAKASLRGGVADPISQVALDCLRERHATQAGTKCAGYTPSDISMKFQHLVHLERYDLVESLLLEQGHGKFDQSGSTLYHKLVSGNFLWMLRRLEESVRDLATHLEDIDWLEQQKSQVSVTERHRYERARPLLLTACESKAPNLDTVKFLVDEIGCNVNAQGYLSTVHRGRSAIWAHESPVHSLVRGGHWWQIVQALPYLAQHGADLEVQDAHCHTPLDAALERLGHADFSPRAFTALLGLGVLVTADALVAAIKVANLEVLTALLDGGGDPNATPKKKSTSRPSRGPLTTPVERPREPPEVPGRANRPRIWLARVTDPPEPDPYHVDKADMYPLDYAALLFIETKEEDVGKRKTYEAIVKTLLAYGADPARAYLDGKMSIVDRIIRQGRCVDTVLEMLGQRQERLETGTP